MATFLKRRRHVEAHEYQLLFDRVECPGSGYGFACDEHGNALADKLPTGGMWSVDKIAAFRLGLVHQGEAFNPPTVRRFDCSYWESAVIRCACGREVELHDPMDNDCDCGAIYNSGGQRVRCYARDIDPADAGERYDDEY